MNGQRNSVQAALRGNRLVCLALLVGQALMAIVVGVASGMGVSMNAADADMRELFSWVGPGIALGALPTAFLLRHLIWKKGASGSDAVVLQSYFAGNIAFQAMLEGAGLLNLTLWLITSDAMPYAPVAGVLIMFGTAALIRTSPPRG